MPLYRFLFAAGIVVAASSLAFWLGAETTLTVWIGHHLLAIGMVHMALLYVTGYRLPAASRARLVRDTLFTAGFLHTLIGLAATLGVAATAIASQTAAGGALGSLFAALPAALVPHILGVMLGHVFDFGGSPAHKATEDLTKLREEIQKALNLLAEHTAGLEIKLRATSVAFETLNERVDASTRATTALKSLLDSAAAAMRDAPAAAGTISEKIRAATVELASVIAEQRKTTTQTADVLQSIVRILESELFTRDSTSAPRSH